MKLKIVQMKKKIILKIKNQLKLLKQRIKIQSKYMNKTNKKYIKIIKTTYKT